MISALEIGIFWDINGNIWTDMQGVNISWSCDQQKLFWVSLKIDYTPKRQPEWDMISQQIWGYPIFKLGRLSNRN